MLTACVMTGDCLLDDSFTLGERFAILDVLKEKQYITAEDLMQIGVFTEETRYHPFFFGLFKEDVAGNAAALLELSYRLTRNGTTIQEMSIQEQQMRVQQQYMMLYYLGMQAGLSSVQAYNAAGSAIRMNGATVAAPGYESVAGDYRPYSLGYGGSAEYIPGQGYSSFRAFKAAQGSAGPGMEWHHIVEQSQINKSGFAAEDIHNTGNMIRIDAGVHRKISGYYQTTVFDFTNGLTVRDWLAGQSFEFQYQFGIEVLKRFGVLK